MQRAAAVLIVTLAALTGCASSQRLPGAAEEAMQNASRFELISVDPAEPETRTAEDAAAADELIQGWTVLGRTDVSDADVRAKLLDAFRDGVQKHDGLVAACFAPRHAIRVVDGTRTHEFLICFQCRQVQWYVNGDREKGFLIADLPEPIFDAVLGNAGVPLAAKAK